MASSPPTAATLGDLLTVEGKAELIAGQIIRIMPSGFAPSEAAFKIAMSLQAYAQRTGSGKAFPDGIGYALPQALTNGRQSFCPDASFYAGPAPRNRMRFVEGAPLLAVEVRSEGDYGQAAEPRLAEKRRDYFEAGTQIVWDVDPIAKTVSVYHASTPHKPTIYSSGQVANAEPALPGWELPIDEIFA